MPDRPEIPYNPELESIDGGFMEVIDKNRYDKERAHALDTRRLIEGSVYSAYGFLLPMALAQQALLFTIRVDSVNPPHLRTELQYGGLKFAVLNSDFTSVSTHAVELRADSSWRIITDKTSPITIRGDSASFGLQTIDTGFITEHSDTTFDDIINRKNTT